MTCDVHKNVFNKVERKPCIKTTVVEATEDIGASRLEGMMSSNYTFSPLLSSFYQFFAILSCNRA